MALLAFLLETTLLTLRRTEKRSFEIYLLLRLWIQGRRASWYRGSFRPTWITEHGKVATLAINRVKRILTEYQNDYLNPSISLAVFSSHLPLNNKLLESSSSQSPRFICLISCRIRSSIEIWAKDRRFQQSWFFWPTALSNCCTAFSSRDWFKTTASSNNTLPLC